MGTGHRKEVSANGTNDEMAANANIHTVISTRYITTCNINYIFGFGQIHPLMFVMVSLLYFWSCSKGYFHNCQFFGHVHRLWSYSFGHLDLVK